MPAISTCLRSSAFTRSALRSGPASPSLAVAPCRGRRAVTVRAFREDEKARERLEPSLYKPSSSEYDYNRQYTDFQESSQQTWENIQRWWDEREDKRSWIAGGIAAIVALYFGNAVVGAIDRVPILPRFFQLIGILYSGYFWYTYLLFAEGRRDLVDKLSNLRNEASSAINDATDATRDTARDVTDRLDSAASDVRRDARELGRDVRGAFEREQRDSGRDNLSKFEVRVNRESREGGPFGKAAPAQYNVKNLSSASASDELPEANVSGDLGVNAVGGTPVTGPYEGGEGQTGYVKELLNEKQDNGMSGTGTTNGPLAGNRRPPALFLMSIVQAPMERDGGEGAGSHPETPAAGSEVASGVETSEREGEARVGLLDPCLGWDTAACEASGHDRRGKPDTGLLDRLSDEAFKRAKDAQAIVGKDLEEENGRTPDAVPKERKQLEDLANMGEQVMGGAAGAVRPQAGESIPPQTQI